jgi:thiol-disulfide isomerase/thioredoxin
MKRLLRPPLFVAVLALLAVTGWLLFNSPFVHGVIVGSVAGMGVIIGSFMALTWWLRKRVKGQLAPPPLPTGSWDYLMELEDLEGTRIASSQFRGRVLILNFWATWCTPCIAEMPSLLRLQEATCDLAVEMVCVSREPRDVVTRFVEKRGLSAPIYRLTEDPPDCFRSRSIPATFVIDKKGMIALRHIGAANWDDDSVVAFVRGLAATPGV